jgi:hypothetical protein
MFVNERTLRIIMIVFIAVALCMVSACQRHRHDPEGGTYLEQNWGRAFEAAKYNQTLHPAGPKNLDPQDGMDGMAVEGSLERYRESFKKEATDKEAIITIQ